MIVDRGAVAAALEQWNDRRRRIFYAKSDFTFDLTELRARKNRISAIDKLAIERLLDARVESVELLPNAGTLHALFRVLTPGRRYILKLALEDAEFGFAIESWAMSAIRPNLAIPAYEAVAKSLPCPFLIIEEAAGQPLTSFENPETQAMPEPLLFEYGRALANIHQLKGRGAGLLNCAARRWPAGLHETWRQAITLNLNKHLEICRSGGAIDEFEQHDEIPDCFRTDILDDAPSRLLHGDPGHHNVFSDGQRITAIIDWEDALVGDPVFDIAYWGTFVRDEMRQRFLDGYQMVAKLPDDFEHRYWVYYLRVAISKTVHRSRFGTKDRPGRPPASQRIQKALSNLAKL